MTVELVGSWPDELKKAVGKIVQVLDSNQQLQYPDAAINIMLVDDDEIARLNKEYSGNAYPTDVLTFAYGDEGAKEGELADIAISIDTAKLQAKQAGIRLEEEVPLLALHGILHALGLDHQTETEAAKLEEIQRNLMLVAGFKHREIKWKH